jgi:hypothetical protein
MNSVQDSTVADSGALVSTAQVPAPAAPRVGPPDTSYYMKLGYMVAGVIFFAYIALLMRRVATVRKAP